MTSKQTMLIAGAAVAIAAAAIALVPRAMADGNNQETINQLTVEIQSIESKDSSKLVTTQLGLAKAWLGEAQAQLTQERDEELARTVKRVRAAVEVMKARIAKEVATIKSNNAKRRAKELANAVKRTKQNVRALEQELDRLTAQVEKAENK